MVKDASTRTLLLLATVQSGSLFAGGFALNEQNATALGQAFAGRSSMATDASTVFGNPAGMTYLERREVSGGFAYVMGSTDISNAQGTFPGTNKGDPVPEVAVPFGYYVHPLGSGWTVGIGIYTPYGLKTEYEGSFQGRYFGTTSELKQIVVQPSIAYRVNDQWSIGGGFTYNHVEGELGRMSPSPVGGADIGSTVTGDDKMSFGYNVGVIFSPVSDTRIGLSYRSEVDLELEGETELNNVPVPTMPTVRTNLEYDAGLDVTLPDVIDLSITQRLNDRWTVYGTVMRTGWSEFKELIIENRGGPTVQEEQHWQDTWTYALGASLQMNPNWIVRAGVAYDETPTRNEHRSVRIPSGDRAIVSVGAGWTPIEHMTADFSYGYIVEEEVGISERAPQGFSYSADFESTIHVVALQLSYRF